MWPSKQFHTYRLPYSLRYQQIESFCKTFSIFKQYFFIFNNDIGTNEQRAILKDHDLLAYIKKLTKLIKIRKKQKISYNIKHNIQKFPNWCVDYRNSSIFCFSSFCCLVFFVNLQILQ